MIKTCANITQVESSFFLVLINRRSMHLCPDLHTISISKHAGFWVYIVRSIHLWKHRAQGSAAALRQQAGNLFSVAAIVQLTQHSFSRCSSRVVYPTAVYLDNEAAVPYIHRSIITIMRYDCEIAIQSARLSTHKQELQPQPQRPNCLSRDHTQTLIKPHRWLEN
jgi:hypothetical protein